MWRAEKIYQNYIEIYYKELNMRENSQFNRIKKGVQKLAQIQVRIANIAISSVQFSSVAQ